MGLFHTTRMFHQYSSTKRALDYKYYLISLKKIGWPLFILFNMLTHKLSVFWLILDNTLTLLNNMLIDFGFRYNFTN